MRIGLSLLDVAVGGVTAGLPLIVEADQGAGRNALFLQIVHGALERGEQVVFLTAEPPSILLEMESAAPRLIRTMGCAAMLEAIRELAPRATFFALNPLTALTTELLDESQLRDLARALYDEWENSHLVLGVETDQLDQSVGLRRVLLETCGAYVSARRKYGPHFTLHVERLRVGDIPEEPLAFRLSRTGALLEHEEDNDSPAGLPKPQAQRARATPAPPPAPAQREALAVVPAASPPVPLPKRKIEGDPSILVIDPDPEARRQYGEWLGDAYELRTAPDGSEGLARVMEARPSLVILDLDLPNVTGFDVLRALGRSREWIPVVVISDRIRRPLDRVRPFLLGASDVIAKPPDRFDLVRKVDSLIQATEPPPSTATSRCCATTAAAP